MHTDLRGTVDEASRDSNESLRKHNPADFVSWDTGDAEVDHETHGDGVSGATGEEERLINGEVTAEPAGTEDRDSAGDVEGIHDIASLLDGEVTGDEEVGKHVGLETEEVCHEVEEYEDAGEVDGGVGEDSFREKGVGCKAAVGFEEGEGNEDEGAENCGGLV